MVIQNIIIPAETEAVHYYVDPERPEVLQTMVVDKEFYLDYDMRATPTGFKSVTEEPYVDRTIDKDTFIAMIKAKGIDKK